MTAWLLACIGLGLGTVAFGLRRAALRQAARARLNEPAVEPAAIPRSADTRERLVPLRPPSPVPAIGVALLLSGAAWAFGARPLLAAALGAVPGVLLQGARVRRVEKRALRLEEQLAEAIQLVAAALRAGGSATDGLERAASEARPPLRPHLDALVARLRLGGDPQQCLAELAERIPLHPFRLFATALGAQWSAGGSLQGSLQSVARAISQRTELARRIDTQQAPTRSSVVAIVGANLAIAVLSYLSNPLNLERFLASPVGSAMLASTLWLQALALWWMARLGARRP